MRFDAYAGNVYGGVGSEEVATLVAWGAGCRVARGKPRGRYHDVFEVLDGADLAGWVGRDYSLEAAYFELKGAGTPITSAAVRKHWPDSHTVSRVDSAEDYSEADSYTRLQVTIDKARDPRVKSRHIEPRGSDDGRTTYWGSPKSRAMVRLYEAGKMRDRLHYGRPDWVRAELQYRPGKSQEKHQAAKMSPVDVWGTAAWSRRAAMLLGAVDVPRFAPPSLPAEFDRTTLYLARAFRRHFEVMLEDFGAWDCIGRELASVWQADDLAQAALAATTSPGGGAGSDSLSGSHLADQ